jgi:hypothetical protein
VSIEIKKKLKIWLSASPKVQFSEIPYSPYPKPIGKIKTEI